MGIRSNKSVVVADNSIPVVTLRTVSDSSNACLLEHNDMELFPVEPFARAQRYGTVPSGAICSSTRMWNCSQWNRSVSSCINRAVFSTVETVAINPGTFIRRFSYFACISVGGLEI